MSKKANPTAIGAFVVGAVVLLALGFALFGGGDLLARKIPLVTYFDGSVQGLHVGSNVMFRGVRVGAVEDIELLAEVETLEPMVRVTMQLDPDAMKVMRDGRQVEQSVRELSSVERLVEAGFSAQLASESLLTGQLLVSLDFRPGEKLELQGLNDQPPEIPSVPSGIQQAIDRLNTWLTDIENGVDFAELAQATEAALTGFSELANSEDLRQTLAGLNRLVNANDTQALPATLTDSLEDLARASREASRLFRDAGGELQQLSGELRPALQRLEQTLAEAQATFGAARRQLQGEGEQARELQATLEELEQAAAAAQRFFDYLERHPEALLQGKQR